MSIASWILFIGALVFAGFGLYCLKKDSELFKTVVKTMMKAFKALEDLEIKKKQFSQERRQQEVERRITEDRRAQLKAQRYRVKLIHKLKMQARTRCAANRVMKVHPYAPEATLEWLAATELEKLLGVKA